MPYHKKGDYKSFVEEKYIFVYLLFKESVEIDTLVSFAESWEKAHKHLIGEYADMYSLVPSAKKITNMSKEWRNLLLKEYVHLATVLSLDIESKDPQILLEYIQSVFEIPDTGRKLHWSVPISKFDTSEQLESYMDWVTNSVKNLFKTKSSVLGFVTLDYINSSSITRYASPYEHVNRIHSKNVDYDLNFCGYYWANFLSGSHMDQLGITFAELEKKQLVAERLSNDKYYIQLDCAIDDEYLLRLRELAQIFDPILPKSSEEEIVRLDKIMATVDMIWTSPPFNL